MHPTGNDLTYRFSLIVEQTPTGCATGGQLLDYSPRQRK